MGPPVPPAGPSPAGGGQASACGADGAPDLQYEAAVPENEAGREVARLATTDLDEPGTPAWRAVYSILRGNEGGAFTIATDPASNEGVLSTAKVRASPRASPPSLPQQGPAHPLPSPRVWTTRPRSSSCFMWPWPTKPPSP